MKRRFAFVAVSILLALMVGGCGGGGGGSRPPGTQNSYLFLTYTWTPAIAGLRPPFYMQAQYYDHGQQTNATWWAGHYHTFVVNSPDVVEPVAERQKDTYVEQEYRVLKNANANITFTVYNGPTPGSGVLERQTVNFYLNAAG